MAEAKKLGDMLKEAGFIDDFQLQSALSYQRNWGGKLGSIIIALEFIGEEDLARVIAEKLHTPYINLFEPEIPENLIRLIKPEVAKKYHVIPARRDKGILMLAMSDPLDIEAIDEIRFITGLNIKPSLALESEINDAIKKYYDAEVIVRKQKSETFNQRTFSSGDKMELIHGSELSMEKDAENDVKSPMLSKEESAQQALQDTKMRFEALTTLLIEKGLISRDELVSMIYQKKMGL